MSENMKWQFSMPPFFQDDREVDVLVLSLARKLLRENKSDLPPSILSCITGVPEDLWVRTYSKRRHFLNDIFMPMVLYSIEELEILDAEELNFMAKLRRVLIVIYKTNFKYPELILLFHQLAQEEDLDAAVSINESMEELIKLVHSLLLGQAYKEGILEKNSPMEKMLQFLIHQMLLSFQIQLIPFCEEYLPGRDLTVFPDEEEWVEVMMRPIIKQLDGLIAI